MDGTQQPENAGFKEELVEDTVVQVGGKLFHVNRRLLSTLSRYFAAMFYGGTKETSQQHVVLKEVDPDAFQTLLEFARTSRVTLDRQNVLQVLETAIFLQFEAVEQLCVKFLERELHVSNCLGMMSYAEQFACWGLSTAARNVVLTHLEELTCQEEFYHLSKEALTNLLQSDNLYVSKEDVVFDAVMAWVTRDAGREKDVLELLGLVRVGFLSLSFLDMLIKRTKRSSEQEVYTRLVRKLDGSPPPSWTDMDLAQKDSRSYDIMYVVGGRHDKEKQELFKFFPKTGLWQPCAPLQRKNLTQYAVAAVGNFVFVTGGYFRDEFVWYSVDWALIYNCWDNTWLEGPAMKKSRNWHCAVGVGLYLYVLGGSTDSGIIPDVERLALMNSEWESTSPMVRPVERAAAVSTGTKLYVLCGLDENGDVYGGVQRLDVESDVWDVVSYSPLPRYDLSATVLNGAIYTIGGQMFRFDVDTDEWTHIEEDCFDRKFFMGCGTANGQVYLLGERKGNLGIPNMVLFDPYLDTCQAVSTNIPCPLPVRGCVTVRRFDTWA
ncbi:kelch-like protein 24 [Latimeria chalumnae]|uniref:BTB domain-containing protein n=1 Tax=Latimeria chalumnae TaxID=7897 RepID=H3B7J6_LATCH|nr:PREDICTED: kelch-like protein 24 [Latimeria chalumnae]|eukprot:XP_005989913.1 PREDICTED: kelch-like protein 24 [Latimeria chalumnae]